MKLKLLTLLCIGILLVFSCQDETFEQEGELVPTEKSGVVYDEGTIVPVQIESKSLQGNLLGDPHVRNVNIYLPKGYNSISQKRYPVIYLLHGQPSSENSLFNPVPFVILKMIANLQFDTDFPQEGFVPWLNNLVENEGMKEVIIVMADATNKFGFSFYTNSPTQGNYEKYIAKDVVKYVDSHFKTIPTAKARSVVGHSMGGYGALRLALKYPHVFSKVAGLSPGQFPTELVYMCAELMQQETVMWGMEGPTIPYNIYAPFKFGTNAIYGLSAARLPNPNNPPYYLDLPFTYDADGNPVLNDELMEKWNAESLFALTEEYKFNTKWLDYIYFDVGINDELGMTLSAMGLHQFMESMEIPHEFEIFVGGHFSNLYNRLGMVLVEVSNKMNPPQLH